MGKSRPFPEVQIDVHRGKSCHAKEGHENAGEKRAFRYEVGISQVSWSEVLRSIPQASYARTLNHRDP